MAKRNWVSRTRFVWLAAVLSVSGGAGVLRGQAIPACPSGLQTQSQAVAGRPYVRHQCVAPEKSNEMLMCREWEGAHWSPAVNVPCGSRVGAAFEYTGDLKCAIGEQITLVDKTTNRPSQEIRCLPPGWSGTARSGNGCPTGTVAGSPALFGEDFCYGPRAAVVGEHDLLAHDINGFALDMTVEQVQAHAHEPLEPLGGGQFKVVDEGVQYDFGFSVLGHLFRVDTDQNLGRFIPDATYARSLSEKMTAKFGPAVSDALPGGPMSWGFDEAYRGGNGLVLTQSTVSLSAMLVGGYGQPVTLHLKLMDFRILRRDVAKANAGPRDRAVEKTKF